MDKRDPVTRQYFDDAKVRVDDQTPGQAFSSWFDNDKRRIARLSGAPKDSLLRIEHIEPGGYKLTATGPYLEGEMVRLILQRKESGTPYLFMLNNAFVLPPALRRQKIGVRAVAISLLEAKSTGEFAHVEVDAIGDFQTLRSNQYSGYAVWPHLGFDGPLPPEMHQKVPGLSPSMQVSEFLALPNGVDRWLLFGSSVRLKFQLETTQNSWVVLNRYMRDNGIEVQP